MPNRQNTGRGGKPAQDRSGSQYSSARNMAPHQSTKAGYTFDEKERMRAVKGSTSPVDRTAVLMQEERSKRKAAGAGTPAKAAQERRRIEANKRGRNK